MMEALVLPGTHKLQVQYWPLVRLVPYARNARTHDDAHIAQIAASITKFGWTNPILVDSADGILAGHGRLLAAKKLGMAEVPVLVLDHLTGAEKRAYILADNKLALNAGWDEQVLAAELADLKLEGVDLDLTGFSDAELDDLLSTGETQEDDPGPLIDKAAELQGKWKTASGQIWQIGPHRIMCGDSTIEADVAAHMQGRKAGLMNTDPPYGVSYANDERPNPGVAKPRVANDEIKNEDLQSFLEKAFRPAATIALTESAAWYLWHPMLLQGYFVAAAAAAAGLIIHRQIVWVKPVLLLTRGQYHWKHELCFMGWVQGHQPPDYGRGAGERDQTTVWEINGVSQADRKDFNHSTPKPVELFAIPIVKHLKPGELCYEPFSGSGPQFVAAQQLNRVCYGMEIEPKYVAVALQRLADLGLKPELAQSAANVESPKAATECKQPTKNKKLALPSPAPARSSAASHISSEAAIPTTAASS